ncbi:MAG: winged helix DNA-binding domain-containing protein, partial [Anaerolineales bacterium]|nr:winged helix DNA-binding domain-containing protein [Anaerolineales bacterium]
MTVTFPLQAARTVALHAQGLTRKNGTEPTPTLDALYRVIEQLACLQIDTLQRVHRTQYLVPWSRLGSYDPSTLDRLAYGDPDHSPPEDGRKLFEFWFHAACYLPLEEYRFRIPRMLSARTGRRESTRKWLAKDATRQLLNQVYSRVENEGALRVRNFEDAGGKRGPWWDWKPAKDALEHLFSRGDLMIADRVRFERVYDLTERILPGWVDRSETTPEQAALHVLERSARALGICTAAQVSDYSHDLGRTHAKPFIGQLLDQGILLPVLVKPDAGETLELVIHKDHMTSLEEAADGSLMAERTTFLSPFDSLFYAQDRDAQFWGFRQVLEAYKPAPQREWGYFCLPILHHHQL